MQAILQYRVRVVLNDSRALVGQLLAFDKHMNLVLAECDEFRRVKRKGGAKAQQDQDDDEEDEMKRTLGLVILRGETIVTLSGEFACHDPSLAGDAPLRACVTKLTLCAHCSRGPAPRLGRQGSRKRASACSSPSSGGSVAHLTLFRLAARPRTWLRCPSRPRHGSLCPANHVSPLCFVLAPALAADRPLLALVRRRQAPQSFAPPPGAGMPPPPPGFAPPPGMAPPGFMPPPG